MQCVHFLLKESKHNILEKLYPIPRQLGSYAKPNIGLRIAHQPIDYLFLGSTGQVHLSFFYFFEKKKSYQQGVNK